jgi:hypothetical protein
VNDRYGQPDGNTQVEDLEEPTERAWLIIETFPIDLR